MERNLTEGMLGLDKIHFLRKKKRSVCMPCRTSICISLLHEVILYHLEDQNCLSFYKHADYYKLFLVF